jgi:hypothetical protein
VIGRIAATAAVTSPAAVFEPMSAPAMAITPTGPRAHAQKDAVVKVARAVKAVRRAGVRGIVVVAILANWLDTYFDDNLCLRGRRNRHADQQCRSTDENLESTHVFPL